jgi:hypothetical protein
VGFEPNPVHKDVLDRLQAEYATCGIVVKVFYEAISDYVGVTDL